MARPTCPPSRSAVWHDQAADERLRRAIQAEPARPSLGELVWADFSRQHKRSSAPDPEHAAAAARPALPSPPEPIVLPIPKTQKGVTDA